MSEDTKNSTSTRINKILKSSLIFKILEGYKYTIKFNDRSTAVNIMKQIGPKSQKWLVRFDNAHHNVAYPHININSTFTGVKDPHIKLPPGALTAAQGGALVGKILDSICYITLVIDGIQLVKAIYKDHKNGSLDNTVECASSKTGQYIGGIVGALVGKIIGSFLIPGVGPVIGALLVGILGVEYGGDAASHLYRKYWQTPQTPKVPYF